MLCKYFGDAGISAKPWKVPESEKLTRTQIRCGENCVTHSRSSLRSVDVPVRARRRRELAEPLAPHEPNPRGASVSHPSSPLPGLSRRRKSSHIPAEGLEAEGEIVGASDDPNFKNYSMSSYGAHFAEVGVDVDTGEIRLRRMLGVFAAGRILNHKTARSQLIGGMTSPCRYW